MKVALVHELLTMRGGAERVLRVLADMFPDAPIHTFLYDERALGDWFPRERVIVSDVQRTARMLPIGSRRFNHHLYLKRFPAAAEAWDFSSYDLVISASSAFAHGIITNGAPKHLCYVHSPARYLWDRTHDVLEKAGHGPLGPLRKAFLSRTLHPLRVWDAEAAARPDRLVAASQNVQRRIELYWRRESTVIPPPIDDFWLEEAAASKRGDYFFIASTLAAYKRIDLAIRACNELRLPLKIAGTGREEARLRTIAGPTVSFLGYVSEEALRELYRNARATIFPGEEDFGLVPLESLACGTPVIAYEAGGALETLTQDTAVFFSKPAPGALIEVLRTFDPARFDPTTLRARAQEFRRDRFEDAMRREADLLLSSKNS